MRDIWLRDGIRGYDRGLSANLIGVTPEKAIKLTVNDTARRSLANYRGIKDADKLPVIDGMLAGAAAGGCQVIATNPMEMVKINMQLTKERSVLQMVRAMGLKGLYKGSGATLMRDIPFSMIFFQSFASISEALKSFQQKDTLAFPSVLLAGFMAGSIGAVLATPMDMVKTRYQAEWFKATSVGSSNFRPLSRIWIDTVVHEGPTALFKGSLQRCLIVGPLFGISLMVFDVVNNLADGNK